MESSLGIIAEIALPASVTLPPPIPTTKSMFSPRNFATESSMRDGEGSSAIEMKEYAIDLLSKPEVISSNFPELFSELPPITKRTFFPNFGIIL